METDAPKITEKLYQHALETLQHINGQYKQRFFYFHDAPKKIAPIVINSPYFDSLGQNYFHLKAQTSASDALLSLLYGTEAHIIDCTVALQLAQYNALRLTLIDCTDLVEGQLRFDRLFGVKQPGGPAFRMLFSMHSALRAHPNSPRDESVLRVNPLLYFMDYTYQNAEAKAQKGHFCYIQGHPLYIVKYHGSPGAGKNGMVCKNETIMVFGEHTESLPLTKVLDQLADAFNNGPENLLRTKSLAFSKAIGNNMGNIIPTTRCHFLSDPIIHVILNSSTIYDNKERALEITQRTLLSTLSFNQPKSAVLHRELRYLAANKDLATLQNFFTKNARNNLDINNQCNRSGCSALHWALLKQQLDNAFFLLVHNASYLLKNKQGETAVSLLLQMTYTDAINPLVQFIIDDAKDPDIRKVLIDYQLASLLETFEDALLEDTLASMKLG